MRKPKVAAVCVAAALALAAVAAVFAFRTPPREQARTVVRIAMPYSKYIYQPGTNYYTQWLEEQTGLDIEIVLLEQTLSDAYLQLLFSSGAAGFDAVFFPPGASADGTLGATLRALGREGRILPLNGYIESAGTHTRAMFASFAQYDLMQALGDDDGQIYYLPNLDAAQHTHTGQTMWINTGWLKNLGLKLPKTTEELRAVLRAFAAGDPNGNGLADEVPIAGCTEGQVYQAHNLLLNSFVYNDPETARIAVENGRVTFSPTASEWRQGVLYLQGLYAEGLISPTAYTFTKEQLVQLVNDPRDLVGCFTSATISDVVLQHSPDIVNRFIHLPPLYGPNGVAWALAPTPNALPGGALSATCQHPQDVFRLMDLMLSEEASTIARYGEENVDWQAAVHGDVGITGHQASIRVQTNLTGSLQNQNLAQAGPLYLRSEMSDSVLLGGLWMEQDYMDMRAAMAYEAFYPAGQPAILLFPPGEHAALAQVCGDVQQYTDEMLLAFITGKADPGDDAAWAQYVRHYEKIGLAALLDACGRQL